MVHGDKTTQTTFLTFWLQLHSHNKAHYCIFYQKTWWCMGVFLKLGLSRSTVAFPALHFLNRDLWCWVWNLVEPVFQVKGVTALNQFITTGTTLDFYYHWDVSVMQCILHIVNPHNHKTHNFSLFDVFVILWDHFCIFFSLNVHNVEAQFLVKGLDVCWI